ncbi:cupin domain-containing protein [Candidatus Bipolaricaulota bacterium]|nr:cupin domain-containing protein [Candidatus Bipolaricaulota bacterium]
MKVINLEELKLDEASEVFYEVEEFSGRVIELPAGGSMPPCEMDSYVLFYVISGEIEVTVGEDKTILKEGSSMVTEPATLSMETGEGVRILGVQVATIEA